MFIGEIFGTNILGEVHGARQYDLKWGSRNDTGYFAVRDSRTSSVQTWLTYGMLRPMTEECYEFEPVNLQRMPRAWERIPKAAFARRRKGRKLWKRHMSRVVEVRDLYTKAEDSAPSIKRLRLAHAQSTSGERSLESKPSQYFATSLEHNVKTPRRKCTIPWIVRAVFHTNVVPIRKTPTA